MHTSVNSDTSQTFALMMLKENGNTLSTFGKREYCVVGSK